MLPSIIIIINFQLDIFDFPSHASFPSHAVQLYIYNKIDHKALFIRSHDEERIFKLAF